MVIRGMIRENKVIIANIVVDVPRRISILRRFEDLTQEDLAKKLGVSQSCVCSWEKGRSKPSQNMICKICDVMHVTLDEFVTGRYAMYGYR